MATRGGLLKHGVLIGLGAVVIGDIIFALIYPIALGIVSNFEIKSFFILFLTVALISGVTGLMASIIPGGIGGICLALLLNIDAVKGRLTLKKASLEGSLVGGLSGIISCLISLFFIFGFTRPGSVFSYGIYDKSGYLEYIRLALITLLPVAISIFMGSWSGRRLAHRLID